MSDLNQQPSGADGGSAATADDVSESATERTSVHLRTDGGVDESELIQDGSPITGSHGGERVHSDDPDEAATAPPYGDPSGPLSPVEIRPADDNADVDGDRKSR